jgi:hypothetical protein
MQIGSSLITTLRISPAKGVLKKLPPILSRESSTLLYIIVTDIKKVVKKLVAK